MLLTVSHLSLFTCKWNSLLACIQSIVVTPQFLSAEPLTNNIVAVTTAGAVDLSTVKVALNNAVSRIWISSLECCVLICLNLRPSVYQAWVHTYHRTHPPNLSPTLCWILHLYQVAWSSPLEILLSVTFCHLPAMERKSISVNISGYLYYRHPIVSLLGTITPSRP